MSHPDALDHSIAFVPVRIAILTVSDTRIPDNDVSGNTLAKRIADAGHQLAVRNIIPDDEAKISAQLQAWMW